AMRTLVAGATLVGVTYLAQTATVAVIWGWHIGAVYLASLPVAAEINFYLSDRLRRAAQRARAYVRFRRDPQLQARLQAELAQLRDDVMTFDRTPGDREVVAIT